MTRYYAALAVLALAGCSSPPAAPKAEKQSEPAPAAVRISQFYGSPSRIGKGDSTDLCYGVDGASTLRLEPAVEQVWPALSRCFEVKPAATTTYTLIAADASGHSVSEKTTIEVGPPGSGPAAKSPGGKRIIGEVTVNKLDVARGAEVTICYTAKGASSVTITPGQAAAQSAERGCITDHPSQTTTYTVLAKGAGGETDSERVTVKVH